MKADDRGMTNAYGEPDETPNIWPAGANSMMTNLRSWLTATNPPLGRVLVVLGCLTGLIVIKNSTGYWFVLPLLIMLTGFIKTFPIFSEDGRQARRG